MNTLTAAENEGRRIANKLNAANLSALRAIPADELQKNAGGFFAPIVDGYILPATVAETYKKISKYMFRCSLAGTATKDLYLA